MNEKDSLLFSRTIIVSFDIGLTTNDLLLLLIILLISSILNCIILVKEIDVETLNAIIVSFMSILAILG